MSAFPHTTREMDEAFERAFVPKPRTTFQLPFSTEEGATMLARTFRNIGLKANFATIVVVLGHGSESVNNPFDAAQLCGACGGRAGGPNGRLMARLANDKGIRMKLAADHGINIPDDTWFLGGIHDTTSEAVDLFDLDLLPKDKEDYFAKVRKVIDTARGNNALERCQKFMLCDATTPEQALAHVKTRSTDLGEARPELGHSTNAAVIIGRRELTKGRSFDRRAFLASYDPYNDNDEGANLEGVIAPALVVCSGISLEYLFSTVEGGAGTKVPMNLVGNVGCQQGTSGDLLVGLPTQITEMHPAQRSLFLIDAPVGRVRAVLARRKELRDIVQNNWVRFFVRDPETKFIYKQSSGEYLLVSCTATGLENEALTFVPATHHLNYGSAVRRFEAFVTFAAVSLMLLSCLVPIYLFGRDAQNPLGPLTSVFGTMLTACALAFSRRYLHGEFMFGRFVMLMAGLSTGFSLVATAPTLTHVLPGWEVISFCSTFLIGAYNDRPSACENATFAFALYKLSGFALLVAVTFSSQPGYEALVALGLIMAALTNSSQFPFTSLFMRSMEGPSPTSALGCAGLSAHVGVVMLSNTMPLWFGFAWARSIVVMVGIITTVFSGLVGKVRADRNGAIASATSSTLGLIYVILAAGYPNTALVLSLGHAAFRMLQFLRAANFVLDMRNMRSALRDELKPKAMPEWVYQLCWVLNRINVDSQTPLMLQMLTGHRRMLGLRLSKYQQWLATGVLLILAGVPFTPVSSYISMAITDLLNSHPLWAVCLMVADMVAAAAFIRVIFVVVLDPQRFDHGVKSEVVKKPAVSASGCLSLPLLEKQNEALEPVPIRQTENTEALYNARRHCNGLQEAARGG